MTSVLQAKRSAALTVSTISVVLDATPTPGSLLIAVLSSSGALTTPTYPWGQGAPELSSVHPVAGTIAALFSKVAGASESTTVSVSNVDNRNLALSVIEASPTVGETWQGLDRSATAIGSATTSLALGPTATQARADDIAIAAFTPGGSITAVAPTFSGGYTVMGAGGRGVAGYRVLSSTAAESTTATWGTSRDASGLIATYRLASGALPTSGQNSGFLPFI